jgi:hypothetical protein
VFADSLIVRYMGVIDVLVVLTRTASFCDTIDSLRCSKSNSASSSCWKHPRRGSGEALKWRELAHWEFEADRGPGLAALCTEID